MQTDFDKTGGKRIFNDAFSQEGFEDMVAQITSQANSLHREFLQIMKLKAADIDRSVRLGNEITEQKTKMSKLEEEKQHVDCRIAGRMQVLAEVKTRVKEAYNVLQVESGALNRSRTHAADQPDFRPRSDGSNSDGNIRAHANASGRWQEHDNGDIATEVPLENSASTHQGPATREEESQPRSGVSAPCAEEMQRMDKPSIGSAIDKGSKSTFYAIHSVENDLGMRLTDRDRLVRDGLSHLTQASSSTSISMLGLTQSSASPTVNGRTSSWPPMIRTQTGHRGRMNEKWPERGRPDNASIGRAQQKRACVGCQRLKVKCVPNETGGRRCLRCETRDEPCSNESSTISAQSTSSWQPINLNPMTPRRRVDESSLELGTPSDALTRRARPRRACTRCHGLRVKCVPNESTGSCLRCEARNQPCSNESASTQFPSQTRGISSPTSRSGHSLDADPTRKAPEAYESH